MAEGAMMCSGTMTARVGSLPACRGAQLALLAAVLTVLAHAPSACAFHALEQREGLMALYAATHGSEWEHNDGWGSGDECMWFGVKCNADGHVHELHLNDNNLYGTLPGKFFSEMPHLRSLFLQTNRIFYTLPPEVGLLSNAAIIWMHENRLSGSIPEEFGQLGAHLQQLYLGDNLLDSTLPDELGFLATLRELRVGDNRLEGTLPASIVSLPNLRVLHAQENHIEGEIPGAISSAAKLTQLRLDSNQLHGDVPPLPPGPFQQLQFHRNRLNVGRGDDTTLCSNRAPGALSVCTVLPQGDPPPEAEL